MLVFIVLFSMVILLSLKVSLNVVSKLEKDIVTKGNDFSTVVSKCYESRSLITTVLNAGADYDKVMGK